MLKSAVVLQFVVLYISRTTSATFDNSTCCRTVVFPEGKAWFDENSRGHLNYTLYDPYNLVTQVSIYGVDDAARVQMGVGGGRQFQANSVRCAKGHRSRSPEHAALAKQTGLRSGQMLCLHNDARFSTLVPKNHWLVVCRERTCTSCHLDFAAESTQHAQHINITEVKVEGGALVVKLKVLKAGMRYNATVEVGVGKPAFVSQIVQPTTDTAVLRGSPIPANFWTTPSYLNVEPLPVYSEQAQCQVATKRQLTVLPRIAGKTPS